MDHFNRASALATRAMPRDCAEVVGVDGLAAGDVRRNNPWCRVANRALSEQFAGKRLANHQCSPGRVTLPERAVYRRFEFGCPSCRFAVAAEQMLHFRNWSPPEWSIDQKITASPPSEAEAGRA